MDIAITVQFLIILVCLIAGTRYGGYGLGLFGGIGVLIPRERPRVIVGLGVGR